MARMLWLADVLRDAGLTVLEVPGWKTRGRDGMRPTVVIGHHTASHWSTVDSAVTNLLVKGRPDLPGPLAHLGLNRRGQYIVIAAGKANHAGAGSWAGANESVETIGIEAYNYGNSVPFPTRELWPPVQLEAYERGVAALLTHLGQPADHFCGHREWATPPGRKPDPSGIDLDAMRTRIGILMQGGEMPFTPEEEAALKILAPFSTFLGEFARAIRAPGPTTAKQGNAQSLLHVLETYRVVASNAGISPLDHNALAQLLGQ